MPWASTLQDVAFRRLLSKADGSERTMKAWRSALCVAFASWASDGQRMPVDALVGFVQSVGLYSTLTYATFASVVLTTAPPRESVSRREFLEVNDHFAAREFASVCRRKRRPPSLGAFLLEKIAGLQSVARGGRRMVRPPGEQEADVPKERKPRRHLSSLERLHAVVEDGALAAEPETDPAEDPAEEEALDDGMPVSPTTSEMDGAAHSFPAAAAATAGFDRPSWDRQPRCCFSSNKGGGGGGGGGRRRHQGRPRAVCKFSSYAHDTQRVVVVVEPAARPRTSTTTFADVERLAALFPLPAPPPQEAAAASAVVKEPRAAVVSPPKEGTCVTAEVAVAVEGFPAFSVDSFAGVDSLEDRLLKASAIYALGQAGSWHGVAPEQVHRAHAFFRRRLQLQKEDAESSSTSSSCRAQVVTVFESLAATHAMLRDFQGAQEMIRGALGKLVDVDDDDDDDGKTAARLQGRLGQISLLRASGGSRKDNAELDVAARTFCSGASLCENAIGIIEGVALRHPLQKQVRAASQRSLKASFHSFLAATHDARGDVDEAVGERRRQLAAAERSGDDVLVAAAHLGLGRALLLQDQDQDQDQDRRREGDAMSPSRLEGMIYVRHYLQWACRNDDAAGKAHAHVVLARCRPESWQAHHTAIHLQEACAATKLLSDALSQGRLLVASRQSDRATTRQGLASPYIP